MPVNPTILVHTGHGLQAWWLFHEPWIFEDGEREEAQAMIRGWQSHMARLAGDRGWVVDATHDLARLMRLPGTVNNKSEPVPVKVVSSDGPRLDRNTVWDYIGDGVEDVMVFKKVAVMGLVLDPDAQAPTTKYGALMENDQKFKKSWHRRRPDLPDQSASSYDMSLASIAVMAGWSDQEVANLLIANRRDNGDDLKLDHTGFGGFSSYYAGTIAKARSRPEQEAATQERQAAAQERLEEGGTLEDLSVLIGVDILDLVMHVGDPPEFWMETPRGGITLGRATNITDQRRFRDAVYGTTGQYILKCKEALWKPRAEAIHACCRVVELGEASHPGNEMAHWVETYLEEQTILEDKNAAAEQNLPFRKDGSVLFSLSGFRQYLRFSVGESLSSHKLGQRLRLCGVTPTVVRVAVRGKETSRNYWERKDG
jgi:hypothetical protein